MPKATLVDGTIKTQKDMERYRAGEEMKCGKDIFTAIPSSDGIGSTLPRTMVDSLV